MPIHYRGKTALNLKFIDWIWMVRGSVPIDAGLSGDKVFDRLDGLFHERGTTYSRTDDALTFQKKGQGAQDKMSVFDRGTLRVEAGNGAARLRYDLYSHALLLCFLAPFFFFGFAKFFEITKHHEKAAKAPVAVAAHQDAGPSGAKPPRATSSDAKPADAKPSDAKPAASPAKATETPMNPIDKFLGAPKPPEKKPGEEDKPIQRKPLSPTPAYVFSGIFAFLYWVGRILEQFLVRRLFQRRISGDVIAGTLPQGTVVKA